MPAIPARTLMLALTLAGLGTVMMIMGMFAIRDLPARFGFASSRGLLIGILLAAPAQFLYAVAADFLFPDADPRLSGALELLPWLVLAATLIGASIWFFA